MTFLEQYIQDVRGACGVDLWLQREPHADRLTAWGITGSGWPLRLGQVTEFDLALNPYSILCDLAIRAREAQAQ